MTLGSSQTVSRTRAEHCSQVTKRRAGPALLPVAAQLCDRALRIGRDAKAVAVQRPGERDRELNRPDDVRGPERGRAGFCDARLDHERLRLARGTAGARQLTDDLRPGYERAAVGADRDVPELDVGVAPREHLRGCAAREGGVAANGLQLR